MCVCGGNGKEKRERDFAERLILYEWMGGMDLSPEKTSHRSVIQ